MTQAAMESTHQCLVLSLHIVLMLFQGVSGEIWEISLPHHKICAVPGSSVVIPCSFTHPSGLTVQEVFWLINAYKDKDPIDILTTPQYEGRVQYSKDKEKNCTMTLTNVGTTDSTFYYARVVTDTKTQRWQSVGVDLKVKETNLYLQPDGEAVEGKQVRLQCKSECILKKSQNVLWMKDGQDIRPTTTGDDLVISNIEIKDAGEYTCALEKERHHSSQPIKLEVKYAPKNTSVSVRPLGEILECSKVTLDCNSQANPQVHSYLWYKENGSFLNWRKSHEFKSITPTDKGGYYCEATNQYGKGRSAVVYVDVQYAPKKTTTWVFPQGEIMEGTSVTLSCKSDANPSGSYVWFKETESNNSHMESHSHYNIPRVESGHSGKYYCRVSNKHGHDNSTAIYLDVLYPPRQASMLLNSTGELQEGSHVMLTCSSDANPPVDNYTWFHTSGDTTAVVGSGEILPLQVTSSRTGLYYCQAKNRLGNITSNPIEISVLGRTLLMSPNKN